MSNDEAQAEELLDIALERIAAEKRARTGRLDLGNLGLTGLPAGLSELDWLEELRLGGIVEDWNGTVLRHSDEGSWEPTDEAYNPNRIRDIAPSLTSLPHLCSLDCSGTDLQDLRSLAGLNLLQILYCRETDVTDLTPLTGLFALQELDFSDTGVSDLAPLAGLSALQSLNCSVNRIKRDDLSHGKVSDLAPLAGLSALEYLDCGSTEVADLTPLAGLSALQELDFSGTGVSDLTPLAGLSALECLDCESTEVADLTPLVGLSVLQELYCSHTGVSDLTPLAGLSALEYLYCGSTEVADLTPLAGLSALQELDFSGTGVSDLTPLAGISALECLNLWYAPISNFPEAVIRLPELEELFIDAQPGLGDIPAEVVSQDNKDNCLPRLRAHLADLAAGAEPLRDLKVIVLGNGRVGKTQICRRLHAEPFEADADSTHGISVTSVELAMPPGEEPAVLNLWDFGGQDIYHGTHALFMHTRALFLLVWTPDSEQGEHAHGGMVFRNHPLPYWLEYIRHLGGEQSPVVLAQNRCDGGLGESLNLPVDEALLRPLLEDGRLFTRVAYSAKDDSGRARLLDALQQAAMQLRAAQGRPLIGRNRLAVWDQIRAWRDIDAHETDETSRRHRLLPYRDFDALCCEHEVHSHKLFGNFLHDAGMVFYRPHLFDNQLVLDQSWALNAVYAIFTREGAIYDTLRRLGGRFTRSILDALLWRARGLSTDDQESLLGMMQTSGICFVHRYGGADEETEYVAPDLLPEGREALADELAARWEPLPGEPLEAVFAYPFLSPSITRAVLSELGWLAGSTALYWRYGLCLYDAASRATAIIDEAPDVDGYGGQIRISIKGADGADRLLRALIERIAKLNEQSGWPNSLLEAEMPAHIDPTAPDIEPATPPAIAPAEPEVYVSYAWARERQDPLVEELCSALAGQGLHVGRDSTDLQPGDRISRYMERLSAGRCVVVVLSEAYLRSEFCMTELYRLYANARQRDDDFLHRIVPLIQDDARIDHPRERIAHAVHWKAEHDELNTLIREHGLEIIGKEDFYRAKLIGEFYRHVGDMLAYANDVLVPRDRPTLSRDGFAMVKGLIEEAIA